MSKPKKKDVVSIDVNMSVALMSKMKREDAYWCAPGYQRNGLKPGFTSYLWEDHLGFKLPDVAKIVLDYPFDRAYTEPVSLVRQNKWTDASGKERVDTYRSDSVGEILWLAGQAYKNAYIDAHAGNNGYWHGIGDLVFECLHIQPDGTITFSVGS